ncbi:glycosyltransferase family 2 protein [Limnospira platensis]|uniref:glycosyltransferase family 2 protein n=1 Tax=Limnospira platensis TaxID=118562 RepID=UPI003D6FF906
MYDSQEVTIDTPLVSVCIPTYNGERFVAEAIASVLSQTYSRIELIISDDDSTDETVAIAHFFQQNSSQEIRVITNQNQRGIAGNCNHCITEAKGKYIKFLFQDDLLAPQCVEKMVDLAEKYPDIALVFSRREMFFDPGSETDPYLMIVYQDFQNLPAGWSQLKPVQWGRDLLSDPRLLEHPINKIGEPTTVLLRGEVCDRLGGFDPHLNQLVDLDLWWRIMAAYQVGFIDETLSYFRLHQHQKTYQNIQEGTDTDLNFFAKVSSHPDYDFLPLNLRQKLH